MLQYLQRMGATMVSKTRIKDVDIAERDEKIHNLELDLRRLEKEVVNDRTIRNEIFKLSNVKHKLPKWCIDKNYKQLRNSPGVPNILVSDWHGGEIVNPKEIYNVNKYNLDIMEKRAKTFMETTINILKHNDNLNPVYPGIVVSILGDMISGDIHEELKETNAMPSIPTVIYMSNILIECLDILIKEFGNVLVPCVTGNHGRNTLKMRAKQRAHTSYDWLLYQMLESHYEQKYKNIEEKPIKFLISLAPDQFFQVYNTKFLATHGDTLGKGGDGIIGCVGPIIRGDHKTRSRNLQIGLPYDIMLLGHYHQLMWHSRFISNGSLIGYNEFASNILRAPYELPKQALFIVHPDHGITYKIDILVEQTKKKKVDWVSWQSS